jgi:hypothetical protein
MSKFTTQELDLASDPTVLLIKYRMMEKVWDFLEEMQGEIRQQLRPLNGRLPKELNITHGKISKGENYKRLPYMMLDFPAFFTKEDILAFRIMFYWGHFISATFHLQGRFLKEFGNLLIDNFKNAKNIYFCVNSSPWEYHYKSNNYVLLNELSSHEVDDHLQNTNFIKLSIKFPVEEMPHKTEVIKSFLADGLKVIQTK